MRSASTCRPACWRCSPISARRATRSRTLRRRRLRCWSAWSDGAEAPALSLADYTALLATLPAKIADEINAAWGAPDADPDFRDGAFRFRACQFGNITVALPPDRGNAHERRADYHDPTLPPRHALLAFGLWLQHAVKAHALLHLGAHGTLEWLPGKAVALTGSCFPEAVVGAMPVVYPFIVSNPGEAAQAKRRIAAVTIGHLPPPLTHTEMSGAAQELERLVDEYAIADGLDRRRRERLARLIVDKAQGSGLAREAGVDTGEDDQDALKKIDAWLCDLKDLAIKDGLHIYGRKPHTDDAGWQQCADAERAALIAALDGKRVAPGPAGAPSRGRRDVLPTGRNLFTADPRVLPTPTAMELGTLAADEVVRSYMQTHGEMPRALVIDLWGSATLAHRRRGDRPRPRADGLPPDLGSGHGARHRHGGAAARGDGAAARRRDLAHFGAVPRPVPGADRADRCGGEARRRHATRTMTRTRLPRRGGRRTGAARALARIFGNAPGAYGAGVEDLLGRDAPRRRDRRGLSCGHVACVWRRGSARHV